MGKGRYEFDHNGDVTSTSISHSVGAPVVNRPSVVAVGTIVWLGSEVMFFAVLVSSSFTAQFGVFAAERLQKVRTGWSPFKWGMVEWFFLSYALGAVFVTGQVFEYANLVHEGVTLASNSYGSAFYLTTGFHALHVTAGLIAMLLIIGRAYSVKNFTHKEATSTIVVSYYWHFVDVVWIGLFLVIYVLK
jgi:cytochrome c oxidase subunit 3